VEEEARRGDGSPGTIAEERLRHEDAGNVTLPVDFFRRYKHEA
jgi:hypothetical protein